MTIAPYIAAMCRPPTGSAFGSNGRIVPELLEQNVTTFCDCIARAAGDHDAKLVVFPEFALTGYAVTDNDSWVDASIRMPGPEIDRLAQAARKAGVYALVQAAERHDAFPGRYFLSAVLVTPGGDVALVHRKNYTLSLRTSPVEIYDRFVQVLGSDAFLPVLETPIGNIGVSIAAEVHWPEAVRELALKGAEIVLNPIANIEGVDYLKRPGAEHVRSVRAFENLVYLCMTNIAGGEVAPQIWDFRGAAIGNAVADGSFTLATLDIGELRATRAAPGMNLLAQIQLAIHAPASSLPELWPANLLPDAPVTEFAQLADAERAAWQRLCEAGRGKSV